MPADLHGEPVLVHGELPVEAELRKCICTILSFSDPLIVTPKMVRTKLALELGLCEGALEDRKETIKELTLISYRQVRDEWDERRSLGAVDRTVSEPVAQVCQISAEQHGKAILVRSGMPGAAEICNAQSGSWSKSLSGWIFKYSNVISLLKTLRTHGGVVVKGELAFSRPRRLRNRKFLSGKDFRCKTLSRKGP